MKKVLLCCFVLMATATCFSQKPQMVIVDGHTDLIAPTKPSQPLIQAVTIELELQGKLSAGKKDSTISFVLTDRTKNNKPKLIDTSLVIDASEWPGEGKTKKIKREIYIRHQPVSAQKFVESAEVNIATQVSPFHTLRFGDSTTKKALTKADSAVGKKAIVAAANDTLQYAKTFGYDNDAELFDLKIKKFGERTELYLCRNNKDTAQNKCKSRVLLGEVSREKFGAVIKDFLKQLPVPGATLDTTKIDPSLDSQYKAYNKFLDSKKPKDSTSIEKQLVVVTQRLEELFNEKNSKTSIGYFKLKALEIPVYRQINLDNKIENGSEKTKGWKIFGGKYGKRDTTFLVGSQSITGVEVVLANGGIRKNGIMLELDSGKIYRNRNSPITLYRLDKMKGNRLFVDDSRPNQKGHYVELGDIFNYVYRGKFSYPGDGIAQLSAKKLSDTVYVGSSVSELVDISVFSDLLALLGRKPNGIIQTQATATFITNTRNKPVNSDLVFHNFVKAYFRISKFDSKYAQLDSTSFKNNTLDSVSRLYLHQIAYLQAGLKTNLLRLGIGNNQQIMLNAGAEINLTNADSLFKKDIVSINYYPELEYSISRLENFGLETSVKYIMQSVSKSAPFVNKEKVWFFNPQVIIYYYPFSNPENKIYIRYAHYAQLGDARYNYPQFQFGFKTNLFNKKEKAD